MIGAKRLFILNNFGNIASLMRTSETGFTCTSQLYELS